MKEDEDIREELDIYQKELDEINIIYTEKSTKVISKEESVDSDVADFKTPLSHQDKEHHSAVNNTTDSDHSNGEMVEGSRYNLNVDAAVEGKEPETLFRIWMLLLLLLLM